ncbi:uncharacterized protein PV09_03498 [Verruconis gallopava]|uniref:Copper transporter n=1 Tax=Verruconis gallopava TaxID=253628 RepID=A0A0D1YY64_9PEZI|nr:uncharacterized protein PV09_03498 [Verruconis gallopava]KIW05627.1 hypothetical protein PV09_03498 [Verruconis gallopava]
MSSAQDPSIIQYVPSPGLGYELGIMFGFIALMIICQYAFHLWFKAHMRKEERLEREKVAELKAKGYLAHDQRIELGGSTA